MCLFPAGVCVFSSAESKIKGCPISTLVHGLALSPTHSLTDPPPTPNPYKQQLGLIPCDSETCDYLYKLGQLDTMAWAEATGIAQAAAKKKRAAAKAAGNGTVAGMVPAPSAHKQPLQLLKDFRWDPRQQEQQQQQGMRERLFQMLSGGGK